MFRFNDFIIRITATEVIATLDDIVLHFDTLESAIKMLS